MIDQLTPSEKASIRERLHPLEVKFTKHHALLVRKNSDSEWVLLCGPCSNWSYIRTAYAIIGERHHAKS